MPNLQASIKHLRQSEKRRKANKTIKNRLKKAVKEMVKLAQQKNTAKFAEKLPEIMSLIDKTAKKHLIHKNNASRKKSRMAHLLASAK